MIRVRDTDKMLAEMSPYLQPGLFVFCSILHRSGTAEAMEQAHAIMIEDEGISLVLPRSEAERLGLKYETTMRQITLMVFSDLQGVGLTAAVTTALANEGIPANVVAAALHDHIFVPASKADHALDILRAVQKSAQDRINSSRKSDAPDDR